MDNHNIIHKLILNKANGKTLCGLEVIALYPMAWYASSGEVGAMQFRVTMEDKQVKCDKCRKLIKTVDSL